jgi:hypothetical protein
MTVTKRGFVNTINDIRCDLKQVRHKTPNLWHLTFKCSDSKQLVNEIRFFADDVLMVTFPLENGKQRFARYLPRGQAGTHAQPSSSRLDCC